MKMETAMQALANGGVTSTDDVKTVVGRLPESDSNLDDGQIDTSVAPRRAVELG